ncbi:hypothetical protein HY745_07145 [Candidatus Desantisbacteria bacterium]|nr:hypothetical protein [Candidatus Desantisbacteria bacterium]
MENNKIILIICFIITIFSSPVFSDTRKYESTLPGLIIFHSLSCNSCIKVKKEIIPEIEKKFRNRILIEFRDIADIGNYKLLISLQEKYKIKLSNDLPVFYREKKIKKNYEIFINKMLYSPKKEEIQNFNSVDLISRFRSFKPATIISAGLIDGINPCAFTVIVFFMSFLVVQGYRKRQLVIIGLSFIFSVFLTYFLLGLGIFGFLYQLKNFWLITRIFNVSIGIFSIILGILSIYDFIKFKSTNETKDLLLQLPGAVKRQIHSVIRLYNKNPEDNEKNEFEKKSIISLVISALISGFLVSLLEAVCTGQVYLPTITFVLKTSSYKLQAFMYLLLYNLMFIFPLFIVFLLALSGTTTAQFSRFINNNLSALKILMAILFFVFGIFLIFLK